MKKVLRRFSFDFLFISQFEFICMLEVMFGCCGLNEKDNVSHATFQLATQSAFTCSKVIIGTLEQGKKFV